MEASTSVEICPSATLVPLVAMSLGLAGEALAAAGRESSAPVHVDSSFAARAHPSGQRRLRRENSAARRPRAGWALCRAPAPASRPTCNRQGRGVRPGGVRGTRGLQTGSRGTPRGLRGAPEAPWGIQRHLGSPDRLQWHPGGFRGASAAPREDSEAPGGLQRGSDQRPRCAAASQRGRLAKGLGSALGIFSHRLSRKQGRTEPVRQNKLQATVTHFCPPTELLWAYRNKVTLKYSTVLEVAYLYISFYIYLSIQKMKE